MVCRLRRQAPGRLISSQSEFWAFRTISFLRAFFHALGPFDAHHHAVHIACLNQFSVFCKTALIWKGHMLQLLQSKRKKYKIFHFLCYRSQVLTDARVALEQFNWNKRWLKNSSAMLGFGILTRMRAFFGRVNISLSFVCTSAGDWVAHVSHSKYFVNTNAIESVWLYSPFPNCSHDTLLYPPFVGICHIWVATP